MNKITHIIFLLKTAKNFLVRSWRSTSVLSFMIFSAVGTLVFLSALATGTSDAMIRNSVGLYSGHISGFDLDDNLLLELMADKDVKSVLQREVSRGILSNGTNAHGIKLIGIKPDDEKANTGLWKKTIKGRFLSKKDKGLYIGANTAQFLNADIGSKISFTEHGGKNKKTYFISGIFKTGLTEFDNNMVFCEADNFSVNAVSSNAAIFLNEGVDTSIVLQRLNKTITKDGKYSPWYELMPDLKQLIDMNKICMGLLTIIVFTIVSIGVSCAFMIFILKNLREYGIMKSMGFSTFETVFLIFAEVFMMIFFAATAGVVAGAVIVQIVSGTGIDISALTSHNRYFIISGIIYPRLTGGDLLFPPMMSLFFCILAAIWPAWTISTRKIAEVMKSI